MKMLKRVSLLVLLSILTVSFSLDAGAFLYTAETGTIENPHQFTADEHDTAAAVYHVGVRYYDPHAGRFISRDPIMDGVNWYAYTNNNPLKYIDPNGKEPVQIQTGSVADMFDELKKRNPDAGEGNLLDFLPGVPGVNSDSVRTPGQIPKNNRYVYTENYGWIDMKHFLASAATAYAYRIGDLGRGNPTSRIEAAVFANLMGYQMEMYQTVTGDRSAFSYEDLPSNAAGAVFGAFIYNPRSELTLFEQTRDWINDQGPVTPAQVTNFHRLPKETERDNPPQNFKPFPIDLRKLEQHR